MSKGKKQGKKASSGKRGVRDLPPQKTHTVKGGQIAFGAGATALPGGSTAGSASGGGMGVTSSA
jgi:hypothetical protein